MSGRVDMKRQFRRVWKRLSPDTQCRVGFPSVWYFPVPDLHRLRFALTAVDLTSFPERSPRTVFPPHWMRQALGSSIATLRKTSTVPVPALAR